MTSEENTFEHIRHMVMEPRFDKHPDHRDVSDLQADPADKLDMLDKWRPASLGKCTFKGVQDDLLAMLSSV